MKETPHHIRARKGDVAERVIAVGDPARVEQLKDLLEEPRLVNSYRGFPVYTGIYKDTWFSIACHGIGGPSCAIVFEELRMLGAEVIVRLGTAGGLLPDMEAGELVIANAATYMTGYGVLGAYAPGVCLPTAPTYEVLEALVKEARSSGLKFRVGPVVSNDAFYAESPQFAEDWRKRGAIAVEMECATLFALAHLRGFKSGAILILTNNVAKETPILLAEQIREHVKTAGKTIIEALRKLKLEK